MSVADEQAPVRRRLSRRGAIAAACVAAALIAVIVIATSGGSDGASADSPSTSLATTQIKRQDLVETESETGTLGYADEQAVTNRLSGTVTWVPAAGDVVQTNHTLYKVDASPVILMNGTTPAYRTLSSSTSESGKDVRQLEHDLRVLGYDPDEAMKVDGEWTSATTDAVERWQKGHGLTQDGSIELGRIAFQAGKRRVASVDVTLGGSSSGSGGSQGSAGAAGSTAAASDGSSTGAGATTASAPNSASASLVTADYRPATTGRARAVSAVYTGGATARAAQAADPGTASGTPTTSGGTPGHTPEAPAGGDPGTRSGAPSAGQPGTGTAPASPSQAAPAQSQPPSARAAPSAGAASAGGGGGGGSASATAAPANTILSTTSTRKVVTVDLETTKSTLAKLGSRVSVELPSGKTVHGSITDVGKVATKEESSSSGGGSSTSTKATIPVTISLFSRGTALDQAPVTVTFEESRAKDVLAIPVTALLAQPGGTFAVEVVDGGKRRLVAVEPGSYTSGFVEITGEGLDAGMTVTNAAVR